MYAVCGELNDSCFLQFTVDIPGNADVWTGDKTLVKGSTAYQKGKFKSTKDNSFVTEKLYINYKDLMNTVQIIATESKLAPLVKIRIGLPNTDKYNVSEFYIKGHLEIETINVTSQQKTVPGKPVMEQLIAGKKLNLLDKLFIEKLGEPILSLHSMQLSIGTIHQISTKANVEI